MSGWLIGASFLAVLSVWSLQRGAFIGAGIGLALLAATRPEGVLAGGLLALAAVWLDGRKGMQTLALFTMGVVSMEAFRWLQYGALLPNTYYAKAPDPLASLAYLSSFWIYGLGLLGPLAILPALKRRSAQGMLLLALVMLAGTLWSGGDWMPGFRRATLTFLILAGLAGVGAGLAQSPRQRVLVGLGLAAWLTGSGMAALRSVDSASYPHDTMAELGHRAALTQGIHTVALVDIGRFGWEFDGGIFDLVGLTDAHLGHLPCGHADKPWDEEWFRARAPDLLIARSETP